MIELMFIFNVGIWISSQGSFEKFVQQTNAAYGRKK